MKKFLYEVSCDSEANLSQALDIWIKFTGYLSKEDLLFISEINDKKICDISLEELDRYREIKRRLLVNELFKKYKDKNCNKEEYNIVSSFMKIPLSKYIESRLTEDELISAKSFLKTLKTVDDLKEYIEERYSNYNALSIFGAYILFHAKEKIEYVEAAKLNDEILKEQKKAAKELRRRLLMDYYD